MSPGLLAVNLNKKKHFDDLQGICNRSIHLLELRFHWSIQVDFMRHVIYVNRQSHVSNCHTSHRKGWSFAIATSCCCLESRSWSCDWGKLALRSIWAPSRAAHTQKTEHKEAQISGVDLPVIFHYHSYGAAFLLIVWIPLINKPAVLYFFYSQGPISRAVFILVLIPSSIYYRA